MSPGSAFVMVLSYSRRIFLHFSLNARCGTFLRGHVLAFAAFSGVARVLLYDFVPGNKIIVLGPGCLCAVPA